MASYSQSLPISGLTAYIQSLSAGYERAVGMALSDAIDLAHHDAVHNAKANFNNTPGYIRTGQLTNSIYKGYDAEKKAGFIASRLVYARILELGGTIKPVYAKHLWIKNYQAGSRFKRMTPREFMTARQSDPRHFSIFKNPHTGKLIAAYNANPSSPAQAMAIFTLRDSVTLKSRPYMQPAAVEAMREFANLLARRLAQQGAK